MNTIVISYLEIGLCLLGLMMHNISILMEMSEKTGRRVGFFRYLKLRPYKALFAALCSAAAFIIVAKMGDLNEVTAFMCGMAGSDMIDRFGRVPKKPE